MPATIFSSASEVKSYGSNLSLNDVTKILSVSGNPASGAGTAAPVGSIALDYTNGKTYKKTGSLATEWAELGSGVGGINYIVNPDAESGTTGWSTYADAAGAQPVDGTGGSPSVTWTRSTTTPLRGTADFNFVKDAVNRQGQGVSYDISIDNADLAKVLTVSFDYEVLSGTYATGDLTVYLIQDPTGTPVVIQPAGFQVVSATTGTKMTQIATFQTDSSQKSYRLCFHIATTSALDYTLALDNIVLGPTQKVYGAPVTDWVSYTPTIGSTTGSVTNATATARYRRVGDSIEGEATITFSGASAVFANPNITLPSGLFGDTSKIPDTDTDRGIGICSCLDAGLTAYGPWYVGYNSITNKILATYAPFVNATSASTLEPVKGTAITNAYPFTFGANDKIFISWKLPILGWSSNVEVSSSTDTRVVAARYGRTTSSAANALVANSYTRVNFDIVTGGGYDTHAAVTTGASWVFTAPIPGQYKISGLLSLSTAGANGDRLLRITAAGLAIYRSIINVPTFGVQISFPVSTEVFLSAGQTIFVELFIPTSATDAIINESDRTHITIERLSGPSQIAASETVAIGATNTSGQSIPNNSPTIVTNWTKDFDTHGAFNSTTGVFTAPIPGKYKITASIIYQTSGVSGDWRIEVYKNGTIQKGNLINGTFNTFANPIVSLTSNLLDGDTIDVRANQVSTASRTLNSAASYNFLYIERVGN
jgi:hypothetical protein